MIVEPFICHRDFAAALRQMMSDLPSPLKSPMPATFHDPSRMMALPPERDDAAPRDHRAVHLHTAISPAGVAPEHVAHAVAVEIAGAGDAPGRIGVDRHAAAVMIRSSVDDQQPFMVHSAASPRYCARARRPCRRREVADRGDALEASGRNDDAAKRQIRAASDGADLFMSQAARAAVGVAPEDVADAVVVEVGRRGQAHDLAAHAVRVVSPGRDANVSRPRRH